jgi:hypothetical protein
MKRHFSPLALSVSVLAVFVSHNYGEPVMQNKETIKHHYKYQPVGTGIEWHNGNGRFNRPLYS